MALPSTGPLSMAQIAAEFGGSVPHSLSEYYGAAPGIPSSGAISFSQFLGAAAGPVVTQQPIALTIEVNKSKSLTCDFSGATPMTFQWYRNGTNALSGATSKTLVVTPTALSQSGRTYFCRATNAGGSTDTVTVAVTAIAIKIAFEQNGITSTAGWIHVGLTNSGYYANANGMQVWTNGISGGAASQSVAYRDVTVTPGGVYVLSIRSQCLTTSSGAYSVAYLQTLTGDIYNHIVGIGGYISLTSAGALLTQTLSIPIPTSESQVRICLRSYAPPITQRDRNQNFWNVSLIS